MHHTIDNTRSYFHFEQANMFWMLGKYMLDGGFGQFRSIVKYVCWKLGKFFAEVNSRGTSQECPECGAIVKKP